MTVLRASRRSIHRLQSSVFCRFLSRPWGKFWVKILVICAVLSLQSVYLFFSFQLTLSTRAIIGDVRQNLLTKLIDAENGDAIGNVIRRHSTSLPAVHVAQTRENKNESVKDLIFLKQEDRDKGRKNESTNILSGTIRNKTQDSNDKSGLPSKTSQQKKLEVGQLEPKKARNPRIRKTRSSTTTPLPPLEDEEDEVVVKTKARSYRKARVVGPVLDVNVNMSIPEFLRSYESYCEEVFLPNVPDDKSLPPCECVSADLVGRLKLSFTAPPLKELEKAHTELELGGHWAPPDCVAVQRVAIIVPFRNREPHLRALLQHMHPLLQRQLLDYRIIVVEQLSQTVFNKAMMMNIGFVEAKKIDKFDCFVFHDVDVLAEDDRNFYTCAHQPRHVGIFLKRFNYKLKYPAIFGAATAFTATQFETVNGFSNEFFGWGGEDDDMGRRVDTKGYERLRFPQKIARYTMITHRRDEANPYNKLGKYGSRYRPRHYQLDGLNSLKYDLKSITYNRLFTHIKAEIEGPKVAQELSVEWPEWKGVLDSINNDTEEVKKNNGNS